MLKQRSTKPKHDGFLSSAKERTTRCQQILLISVLLGLHLKIIILASLNLENGISYRIMQFRRPTWNNKITKRRLSVMKIVKSVSVEDTTDGRQETTSGVF